MKKTEATLEPVKESPKKSRSLPARTPLFIGGGVIVVGLLAAAIYFFLQYQNTQKLLTNPNQAAKQEAKDLIMTVGRLMELPKDEVPTIATVSDKSKLQDQVFFIKAENGDKVLIYPNTRKAILFRPATNKIIDVTSVNINGPDTTKSTDASPVPSTTNQPSPTPTVAQQVKVGILNGTKTSGLAAKAETSITTKYSTVTVVAKGNTVSDYQATVVIDLNNKQKDTASKIASLVGGKVVTTIPTGETAPQGAEILVILGTDYVK